MLFPRREFVILADLRKMFFEDYSRDGSGSAKILVLRELLGSVQLRIEQIGLDKLSYLEKRTFETCLGCLEDCQLLLKMGNGCIWPNNLLLVA
jgi:hypothetical protein